jgi:hypothetical protein
MPASEELKSFWTRDAMTRLSEVIASAIAGQAMAVNAPQPAPQELAREKLMDFSHDEFRFPSKFIKENPHRDEPLKEKIYEILRNKYEQINRENNKSDGQYYYAKRDLEKKKWRKYLKSLGIGEAKEGILDPSSEMEWEQRYLHIPEETQDKIIALGLP